MIASQWSAVSARKPFVRDVTAITMIVCGAIVGDAYSVSANVCVCSTVRRMAKKQWQFKLCYVRTVFSCDTVLPELISAGYSRCKAKLKFLLHLILCNMTIVREFHAGSSATDVCASAKFPFYFACFGVIKDFRWLVLSCLIVVQVNIYQWCIFKVKLLISLFSWCSSLEDLSNWSSSLVLND